MKTLFVLIIVAVLIGATLWFVTASPECPTPAPGRAPVCEPWMQERAR